VPDRRPTIADVARHAGVSKGAVSFALNGRAGVKRGHQAAHPRRRRRARLVAQPPGQGAVHLPCVLTGHGHRPGPGPARRGPVLPHVHRRVEKVLAERDQALVLQVVTSPAAEEAGYRRLARDGRVTGVFLVDLRQADPRIALLEEIGLPAVTLNRPDVPSPFPAVVLDDRPGIAAAVRPSRRARPHGHRTRGRPRGLPPREEPSRRVPAGDGRGGAATRTGRGRRLHRSRWARGHPSAC